MTTESELAAIVALTEAASIAWMNGEWEQGYGTLLTAADDASIYGPFGGPATLGTRTWAERGSAAVRQFRNGRSRLTLVQHYCSGDLLVLVLFEDQAADIADRAAQPWSLRVTQVYRREHGAWKVVHRHADPLVKSRSMEQALTLAAN